MNRQQANAKIAKRLWPTAEVELLPLSQWVNVLIYDKPNETRSWHGFDVFTDEAAARELVQWFFDHTKHGFVEQRTFWDAFRDGRDSYDWHYRKLEFAITATAQEKARCVCVALGIEVEEDTK